MMKIFSKLFLIILLAAQVAGCKLAIIVPEGGEVTSNLSGYCYAGSVCTIEVTDMNFVEVFQPVPDSGWYFDSWSAGDRFFCGGSTERTCRLSLQELNESEAVQEIVASAELFYLMPVFKEIHSDLFVVEGISSVKVANRKWLQPSRFVNYSYDELRKVCPDGVCTGRLPSKDLRGYIWASSDDIRWLFEIYASAGRSLTEDFKHTRIMEFYQGDLPIIEAMLSDPPNALGTEIAIHVTIGDSIQEASLDLVEAGHINFGAWFWKPIE